TEIGFSAYNPVAHELIVVAAIRREGDAVGAFLGVPMIVVAEEIDGPNTVCSANRCTGIPAGPIICAVCIRRRSLDQRLHVGRHRSSTKYTDAADDDHPQERCHRTPPNHQSPLLVMSTTCALP